MDYFRNTVVTTIDLAICGGIALLLLITTGVMVAVLASSRGKLRVIDQEIVRLAQDLAQAQEVAARQDELAAEIEEVKGQIKEFEAQLPTQREIPRLLDSFQQVAALSGIQYQKIVAESAQEQPLYVKLPFTVQAYGRYPQFGQFLKDLEFGERFIKVESIKLEQEKDSFSKATFRISTYTFIEDDLGEDLGEGT